MCGAWVFIPLYSTFVEPTTTTTTGYLDRLYRALLARTVQLSSAQPSVLFSTLPPTRGIKWKKEKRIRVGRYEYRFVIYDFSPRAHSWLIAVFLSECGKVMRILILASSVLASSFNGMGPGGGRNGRLKV